VTKNVAIPLLSNVDRPHRPVETHPECPLSGTDDWHSSVLDWRSSPGSVDVASLASGVGELGNPT
jgi:hypothetical protein